MVTFTITRESARPARATFARLVDWDAHSAAIPLTRLRHAGEPAVGQRFVARTGWPRVGFDDPMVVEVLRPPGGDEPRDVPGEVAVAKTGRVIAGRVRWTVRPTPNGSLVEWQQDLVVPWLPGVLDPLVRAVGRLAYTAGLARLLR